MCIRDSNIVADGTRRIKERKCLTSVAYSTTFKQHLSALFVPVSYTHLDVYKRQSHYRSFRLSLFPVDVCDEWPARYLVPVGELV